MGSVVSNGLRIQNTPLDTEELSSMLHLLTVHFASGRILAGWHRSYATLADCAHSFGS